MTSDERTPSNNKHTPGKDFRKLTEIVGGQEKALALITASTLLRNFNYQLVFHRLTATEKEATSEVSRDTTRDIRLESLEVNQSLSPKQSREPVSYPKGGECV